MKAGILSALRVGRAPLSSAALGDSLGVSGEAVAEQIGQLRAAGYDIRITPEGYRMGRPIDALYPWEFPGREDRVHYFDRVSSTMDIAGNMAKDGCPHMTVVVAGRQSSGRGRLKRTWLSTEGGLYFNMILQPDIPPAQSYKINFLASLVVSQVLERAYGIDARVKWPNDVLVDGAKISGMLAELETAAGKIRYINIGIGINVNNSPAPAELKAISVKTLLNRESSLRDLLSSFLEEFEDRVKGIGTADVIGEWKRRTVTLNQNVRIVTARNVTEGVAVDVIDTGALLVKRVDGSIETVVHGDCFLI